MKKLWLKKPIERQEKKITNQPNPATYDTTCLVNCQKHSETKTERGKRTGWNLNGAWAPVARHQAERLFYTLKKKSKSKRHYDCEHGNVSVTSKTGTLNNIKL
jgi:hypothetical protein